MEKDVDEVVKIARNVKAKLQTINKEVLLNSYVKCRTSVLQNDGFGSILINVINLPPELSQSTEAWM